MALCAEDLRALRLQRRLSAGFAPLVYFFLILAERLYFRYRYKNLDEFRAEIWKELEGHRGPVIWAANHLTLIDSFLVFRAVFPWQRLHREALVPWSTPEYVNYYRLGGFWRQRIMRVLLYLCRCIPFLRAGEDEASVRWRETAFEKCAQILKDGGSVFVYPEAGRSRKGWFEQHRPKDFLGRLALAVPEAKFLCVYLRGENQIYTTVAPAEGEAFRAYGGFIAAAQDQGASPRAISQKLFDSLALLQERWFAASSLLKNCGGNDVVDLRSPLLCEHFDLDTGEAEAEWLERHLTAKEADYLAKTDPRRHFATFWKFMAAKEAAYKAFARSGIHTPRGAYTMIEADLFLRKAAHLPTGAQADLAFTAEDEDKIHCLAVLRGGYIGDDHDSGDVLWGVDELPPGASPSDFVRERCLALIAQSSDDIPSPECLAFTDDHGMPQVLYRGKVRDWSVSLSHSGRFVAYSFMAS